MIVLLKLSYICSRVLLTPFLNLLLPFLNKKAKERVTFENKNLAQTPLRESQRAQYAFEVSSEGELEQVMSLLIFCLHSGSIVELVFCSESVEKRCLELRDLYPEQLRVFRLPLLTFNPFIKNKNAYSWISAKVFFMCRYDFFPELIFYGKKKDVEFILLSGALFNFSEKSPIIRRYLKFCYQSFNKIITVSNSNLAFFEEKFLISKNQMFVYDFREPHIQKRLLERDKSVKARFPVFFEFEKKLLKNPSKAIIFGSFWSDEVRAFKGWQKEIKKADSLFCVVPHLLGKKSMDELEKAFSALNINTMVLTDKTSAGEFQQLLKRHELQPGIWIFDIRGILCELYSYFTKAYVGGGFGESIHSVLEPFLCGSYVFTGPQTERSSEYLRIYESDKSRVFKVEKISNLIGVILKTDIDFHESVSFLEDSKKEKVIEWLGMRDR